MEALVEKTHHSDFSLHSIESLTNTLFWNFNEHVFWSYWTGIDFATVKLVRQSNTTNISTLCSPFQGFFILL